MPVTTFPQGYFFEWFCSFIPIQFSPNTPLSIKSTENYSILMWPRSWGGHCMPDFIRVLPVYHRPLWKWLMNLSVWAFGVKSQILNENLIGDLMKNHFVRSLVELELYASPPSREELGFQMHPEASHILMERVKYKPNLCNQVHLWET